MRRSSGKPALRSIMPFLHYDRAARSVDHAAELGEEPVPCALDDPATMGGDRGIDQIAPQPPEPRQRSILVRSGQPAVADDIGDQDRGNLARFRHGRKPLKARTIAQQRPGPWAIVPKKAWPKARLRPRVSGEGDGLFPRYRLRQPRRVALFVTARGARVRFPGWPQDAANVKGDDP
jgi:hypothetical protein